MLNNDICISIIVPIYKTELYIRKCVDSLINQSYDNIKILLIDDGSPDNCPAICDEYAKKDKRVVSIHKKNGGLASVRKYGLEICDTPYVMFVDSDDWLELDTIRLCVDKIKENEETDVVFFPYFREYHKQAKEVHFFNGDKFFCGEEAYDKIYRRIFGLLDDELKNPELGNSIVTVCMKLYKTEVARHGKYYDLKEVGSFDDGLFNIYALRNCNTFAYIDKCLYHYRKGTGQTAVYREKLVEQWNYVFDEIRDFIKTNDLSERFNDALKSRISLSIIGIGLVEFCNKNVSIFKRIKNVKKYISSKKYKESIRNFSIKRLPLKWKLFMLCCKLRLAVFVYFALYIMNKTLSRMQ